MPLLLVVVVGGGAGIVKSIKKRHFSNELIVFLCDKIFLFFPLLFNCVLALNAKKHHKHISFPTLL
jgi:hypothetical protein